MPRHAWERCPSPPGLESVWERRVLLLTDRTRAFGEVARSVLLFIEMKVLGGERRAVKRAQPAEADFQRHLSNLLEAWVSREGESICPFVPENVLGDCHLFIMPTDSPEGRAARSWVIRNLGLLSQSPRVPGERYRAPFSHFIANPILNLLFPRRRNIL